MLLPSVQGIKFTTNEAPFFDRPDATFRARGSVIGPDEAGFPSMKTDRPGEGSFSIE